MRRSTGMIKALAAAVLAVAATGVAGTAGTAGAATCAPVDWGSLPKTGAAAPASGTPSTVSDVRSGPHDCYDRLVVDLAGPAPAFNVRYVDQVTEDGSGRVVPLRGGAKLQVTVQAPSYDVAGHPTYVPANPAELTDVGGYRTFRQVAWAGTFEGYTTLGLGVRARLPMRVFQLAGPGGGSRVVVDVAHTW
jgi:hypothetical protein